MLCLKTCDSSFFVPKQFWTLSLWNPWDIYFWPFIYRKTKAKINACRRNNISLTWEQQVSCWLMGRRVPSGTNLTELPRSAMHKLDWSVLSHFNILLYHGLSRTTIDALLQAPRYPTIANLRRNEFHLSRKHCAIRVWKLELNPFLAFLSNSILWLATGTCIHT